MDGAKEASKMVQPKENDHGESCGSHPDRSAREFATEGYTTALPRKNKKIEQLAQLDKSTTHGQSPSQSDSPSSSSLLQLGPSVKGPDKNSFQTNATPETIIASATIHTTKDSSGEKITLKESPVKQMPIQMSLEQQNQTIENLHGDRDTPDNPPAQPLTVTATPTPTSHHTTQNENASTQRRHETTKTVTLQLPNAQIVHPDASLDTNSTSEGSLSRTATHQTSHVTQSSSASVTPVTAVPVPSSSTAPVSSSSPAAASSSTSQAPDAAEVNDGYDVEQEALRKERSPLVDFYQPYIVPSDTCLEDARRRLEIALRQTRKLQNAFTERVYQKYRVCLKPPPTVEATLQRIRDDPITCFKQLQEENEQIRAEKEIEKKEAVLVTAELQRQPSSSVEQAEQLMYMTAGLNLVMLPEDTSLDPECWKSYTDGRAPTNELGQRSKAVSVAAATAGDLVLDRTRKAAALRVERHRRRQLQLLSGDNDASRELAPATIAPAAIASVLQAASLVSPTNPPLTAVAQQRPEEISIEAQQTITKDSQSLKPAPATVVPSSKVARSRSVTSPLTPANLLSLHYSADQLDAMSYLANRSTMPVTSHHRQNKQVVRVAASTGALMSRGVGAAMPKMAMSTQIRLRHPHPESLGGQRRANTWTGSTAVAGGSGAPRQQAPFSEAYLKQTLPPLPTVRDRLERKPVPVMFPWEAATARAQEAVKKVLEPFVVVDPDSPSNGPILADVTKIRILHNLWKLGNDIAGNSETDPSSAKDTSVPGALSLQPDPDTPMDPVVAFMVLHSVGLIARTKQETASGDLEDRLPEMPQGLGSEKLTRLRQRILQNGKRSFTDVMFSATSKRKHDEEPKGEKQAKKQKLETVLNPFSSSSIANVGETLVSTEVANLGPTDAAGVPILSLRGGGEEGKESDSRAKSDETRNERQSRSSNNHSGKSQDGAMPHGRSAGRPLPVEPQEPASLAQVSLSGGQVNPGYLAASDRFHHSSAMNSLHLAQQLRQATFQQQASDPGTSGLPYLAGSNHHHHHENFDLASFVQGANGLQTAHNSIAAINLARQNQAMAEARAQLYAREQAQAALLRGGGFQQHSHGYGTVSSSYPAFAALLGSTNQSALLGTAHYPVSLTGHVGTMPMPQAIYQTPVVHREISQAPVTSQTPKEIETQSSGSKGKSRNDSSRGETSKLGSPHRSRRKNTESGARSRSTSLDRNEKPPPKIVAPMEKPKPEKSSSEKQKTEQSDQAILKEVTEFTKEDPGPQREDKKKEPKDTDPTNNINNAPMSQAGAAAALNAYATPAHTLVDDTSSNDQKVEPSNLAKASVNSMKPFTDVSKPLTSTVNPSIDTTKFSLGATKPSSIDPKSSANNLESSANNVEPSLNPNKPAPALLLKADGGMRFDPPPAPPSVSELSSQKVRSGRFHEAVESLTDTKVVQDTLTYLVHCGTAIPLPRSLILNPLRERLNTPGFKSSSSNGLPTIPRDIVAYAILVWLWANHELAFRNAFEKSGRIDVDPDCKWLINAAVDTSIRELTSEIAHERATSTGPYADPSQPKKSASTRDGLDTPNEPCPSSLKVEIHTAMIVCRSLMTELRLVEEINMSCQQFQDMVEYLDEARMCSLQAKSQERVLLANLLARKTTINEAFSNAYTSAIVRAGEAFGHENLLEVVQNETVHVASMIPYDICSDDIGEWEDPCRPDSGFAQALTAVELGRRAHAKAMFQKSLRKLQDRHNMKGGVSGQGALSDQPSEEGNGASRLHSTQTPRGGYKRKWLSVTEPPPPPGTGSVAASGWASYEPRHYCAPLHWDPDRLENTPYGQHDYLERPRSLSLSLSARSDPRVGKKARRSLSMSSPGIDVVRERDGMLRSTCEIPWGEVAGIFQTLELPKKSLPKISSHDHHASVPAPAGSVIVAPFCKELVGEPSETEESDSEENLSDEYVVQRHDVVLHEMKQKLSAYLEAKQRQSEKKRGRVGRDK